MPFRVGEIAAGEYEIEGEVGAGSFGRVYRAVDVDMNRYVAIKELNMLDSGLNPVVFAEYVRRFRREADVQSQINHPNIVQAYRLAEMGKDRMCLAMEFMDGGNLRDLLARKGRLPVGEAIGLFRQVLGALEAVHKDPREIIHRDIKPSNLLLTGKGSLKLGDFGLAQIGDECLRSRTQQPHPGTPNYMAPEQSKTQDYLYPPADIYSAGCVLFEMLTGVSYVRACREGQTLLTLLPDVPLWLENALTKALEKDPNLRFKRAKEFDAALAAGFAREAPRQVSKAAQERADQERALREELATSHKQRHPQPQGETQGQAQIEKRRQTEHWQQQQAQALRNEGKKTAAEKKGSYQILWWVGMGLLATVVLMLAVIWLTLS